MNTIDIICGYSDSFSTNCFNTCTEHLLLGTHGRSDEAIYLYFDFSSAASLEGIKEAKLILYKIPIFHEWNHSIMPDNPYYIAPLTDYYSTFHSYYRMPQINSLYESSFESEACNSYVEINVTAIMNAWIGGNLENKGLLLTGEPDAPPLSFASHTFNSFRMRPMVRIIPLHSPTQELSETPCIVTINECS